MEEIGRNLKLKLLGEPTALCSEEDKTIFLIFGLAWGKSKAKRRLAHI